MERFFLNRLRKHKGGRIQGKHERVTSDFKKKAWQMATVLTNIHHSRSLRLRESFVRLIVFKENN